MMAGYLWTRCFAEEPSKCTCSTAEVSLRTRLAEVERERDAAQNECHNLMKPLRSPNPTISLLRLLLVPTMSGTVTVKQETLGGLIRDVEALTCQRDAAIRERDTLTRQAKVLREACENMHSFIVVMYGNPDGSVPEMVTTPLGISVKLGQIVAQALAALTSEGAAQ